MHCTHDLLAWLTDQWLAMSVHDAKLYSLNVENPKSGLVFFSWVSGPQTHPQGPQICWDAD